ncbi:MAG TPA: flagellar basal-body rod protein FlgF [Xanthobacteraceae bacterium]|nr:flagellar basal-body rod protein FlgF [Xanthobacteraceae bacterium]
MDNAHLIGLSRQVALMRNLEVVANNIANVNTTGFKGDSAIFEEFLSLPARETQTGGGSGLPLSFVHDRGVWRDYAQGSVQATGNPLDVAIVGEGFLVVQTPNGERYTRNGALQIATNGQLVTSEGMPVLGDSGPITFQPTDRNIAITKEGRITVNEGAETRTEGFRGKLRVVRFANPQQLRKDGSNNFVASDGIAPTPVTTRTAIQQASIEKSNINAVMEMTRMIDITRTYTQIANMLQQHSDLRRNAIQQLAEVPA